MIRTVWTVLNLCALAMALSLGAIACDEDPIEDDSGRDLDGGQRDGGRPDAQIADVGTDAGGGGCEGPPGLYVEGGCDELAEGVLPYHPRHVLWTDGAAKERFIYLPPDTEIDLVDDAEDDNDDGASVDNWVFPVGTRIYKNFSLSGMLLETRVLEKVSEGTGPDAWSMRVYAWNLAQNSVTEVTNAPRDERENVLGTQHDIPNEDQCVECHSASLDTVNGFSALQINHEEDGITLRDLIADTRFEGTVTVEAARFPEEGVEDSELAVSALGYLHANCGHCHRRGVVNAASNTGLFLWTAAGLSTLEEADAYVTAVGVESGWSGPERATACPVEEDPCYRIEPAMPTRGILQARMRVRGGSQMPQIGTEIVHSDGVELIEDWIMSLPPL